MAPSGSCSWSGWSRDRRSAEASHRRPRPGRGGVDGGLPRAALAILAAYDARGRRTRRLRTGCRALVATRTPAAPGRFQRPWIGRRAVRDLPGGRPDGSPPHARRRSRDCRDLPVAYGRAAGGHRRRPRVGDRAGRGALLAGSRPARLDAALRAAPRDLARIIYLWGDPPRLGKSHAHGSGGHRRPLLGRRLRARATDVALDRESRQLGYLDLPDRADRVKLTMPFCEPN